MPPTSAASTGQPVGSESVSPATHVSPRFATGDVFIGVGNGQIQWRHPDGTLNATLDTGLGGFTTGMAFDKLGNLYSTAFTAVVAAAKRPDPGPGDTSPNDGVYGAYVWATDLAGAYQLEVAVSGTRADGKPIARQESALLTLGSKIDTDIDGVADAAETLLGTNPTSATDGAVDWDGDGVGLASELITGTDYDSWDTDAGGENDESELAAGRDPRRAADDRTFPQIWLSTQAIDGSRASIAAATSDGTGQVRLYRVDDVARSDLGLKPGAGSTFVDGPVVAGSYRYVALVVAADGSMSAPIVGPTLNLAADVTAPFVRIAANDGVWATTETNVRITFLDLSEPVADRRIAESEAQLQTSTWVPYSNPTTFTINSTAGRHIIYAQVRDAAGNVSNVASAIVDLAPTGTAEAWGSNSQGQLGNGSTANSSTPVSVSGLTGITALGAGAEHSLAVRSDGTAWGWGQNAQGELGDGTIVDRTTPVQVSGLTGVIAVDGGPAHSLALKSDGTVWAWGLNNYGQLGDGTLTDRLTPVQVAGLGGVIAIAAGGDHSLALKSDGTVWAWGKNTDGQLGDGSKQRRTTPVRAGTLTGIVAIDGGDGHSLAAKSDGTVWAWGDNFYGQLGDGTTRDRTAPVQVSGFSGAVEVAAGATHSLARKSDGTLYTWGYNLFGQLGDGTTTTRTSPNQVSGLSGITRIAGGAFFSLAATGSGA